VGFELGVSESTFCQRFLILKFHPLGHVWYVPNQGMDYTIVNN